ncbi:MAG TPA: helix-turn-helix domain-containing protein [Candidatus Fimimorpha excrementavium]|nr:helix-turn-helix domain-containing protein [Candidatus Fimimorpha excrementavium]
MNMSRKEMAQYLSVNRSALSRALTDMKKEGLILWNRNHFLLLYRDSGL